MNKDYIRLRSLLLPVYGEGEARAIALLVFEEAFGVCRTDIYADKVRHFSQDERLRFFNICERLSAGEPVQQVLGFAWFCGQRFSVSSSVLVPRPETEELVAWALSLPAPKRVLDAGTGSGCIAVSIKQACPQAQVVACDISADALKVAKGNAEGLGVDVQFERCDLLGVWPWHEPFDLIVSNPPYICECERAEMEHHVLDYEPAGALFVPDADPLLFYRALAERAAGGALRSGGVLMVEINRAYGRQVLELFGQIGFSRVELRRDFFDNDRMVAAWL